MSTPLEPRDENAADRDEAGAADGDSEPDALTVRNLLACHDALSHVRSCSVCRAKLFAAAIASITDRDAPLLDPNLNDRYGQHIP